MPGGNCRFRHSLQTGHFAVTAEVLPPRAAQLDSLTAAAATLAPVVAAVNVTDGAGARVRLSSLAAAIHLRQQGIDPILQMTCRDRNRIAIQSDLLGAWAHGVQNVLVLGGDSVAAGDEPGATAVFDFDSRSLLAAIKGMHDDGRLGGAASAAGAAGFFCGAAEIPREPPQDCVPQALLDKAAAGAQFVQMQFCYDTGLLRRYLEMLATHGLTERLYILAGLGPLHSAEGAAWMRDNLFGTVMPDGVIRRLAAARDARREGIRICAELINEVRDIPGIAGVHLMAPGRPQAIVDAVTLAGTL